MTISGELDTDEADLVARHLAVPSDGPALGTVVDLSGVGFAGSSLLHTLLTAQQDHEGAGIPFVLADVSPFVRRLLDLTDTARAFTLAARLPEAAALARPHRP